MILLPKLELKLSITGENIKLARLRRNLTLEQVSERSGVVLENVIGIENGVSNITIGEYILVLRVYNLDSNIFDIASDDIFGRKLQDINLLMGNIPYSNT